MANQQNTYLVSTMPMRFNGLVVETTNVCNAQCRICYQSAGPKGSEVLGCGKLDIEVAERIIRESLNIPTLIPKVHIAGGEAFLYLEECLHLFVTARDAGFLDISGTTNGYWGRAPTRAEHVASRLREAGVTSMEISWDFWHSEFIPSESVSNCLIALNRAGIETNLRVLTTKSHGLGEALRLIEKNAVNNAHRITTSSVFNTGRASKSLHRDEFHKTASGHGGSCHSLLNLTVNSLGYVFPCCAGSDQTREYLIGNVYNTSIVSLAERMNLDPILRLLVFKGASHLLAILNKEGIDIGEDFDSMCHLCWCILTSEEAVGALRQFCARHLEIALEKVNEELAAEHDKK